jgi:hypothetical protein
LSQPAGRLDTGSPDHNTTPCHGVRSDLKLDKSGKLENVQTIENALENRKCLFSTEIQLLDGSQPPKDSDDVLGCEWSDLISTTSGELLAYDTSIDGHHKGVQLAVNNAESCGYLLSKLTGDSDPGASSTAYYQELMMGEDQIENPQIFQDGQQVISTEEIQDNIYEANGCIPSGCKVLGPHTLYYISMLIHFSAIDFGNFDVLHYICLFPTIIALHFLLVYFLRSRPNNNVVYEDAVWFLRRLGFQKVLYRKRLLRICLYHVKANVL